MRCHIHSENSIIIYFASKPSRIILNNILITKNLIQNQLKNYYIKGIPSYISLMVFIDIDSIPITDALIKIKTLLKNIDFKAKLASTKTHNIMVNYNFIDGFDLENLLVEKSIGLDEFIRLHTSVVYDIYSVGFLPNFAYLGNLDEKICSPRLKTPRKFIPSGSVGIADCQTGIYPQNSPAGWKIIGIVKSELPIFNVGDKVKFFSNNNE